jgi:hypothetical protein
MSSRYHADLKESEHYGTKSLTNYEEPEFTGTRVNRLQKKNSTRPAYTLAYRLMFFFRVSEIR